MKLLKIILIFGILIALNCGKDSVNFSITGRLEDVIAGWWINQLEIDYSQRASHFVTRVVEAIKLKGERLEYIEEGNDRGYTKYKVTIDNSVMFFEVNSNNQEVILVINQPGILYSKIMGEDYHKLPQNRKYECEVVYRSKMDNARLFLCGKGKYCVEIMIMSGT